MMFVKKFSVINYGSRLESIVESIMYIKEKYVNLGSININDIYNIQLTILILKTKYY